MMRWIASYKSSANKLFWFAFYVGVAAALWQLIQEGQYGVIVAALIFGLVVVLVVRHNHGKPE